MGAAASVSGETELSAFKEMRAKFEALKAEGKTDEDIYTELKALYNTAVGAGVTPPVADGPIADGDVEKPAAAPDTVADATPAAGTATAIGEVTAEPVANAATEAGGGGSSAAEAVSADAPEAEGGGAAAAAAAAEGAAPVEVASTTE